MKKLSLILVALATMVMVGCKPLTGDNVCVHTNIKDAEIGTVLENGEVVSAVTSAWYGYNESGKLDLVKTEVATHYVCTDCGKVFKKNVAFFTTDDHKTTIGVATDVSKGRFNKLPIDEELTTFYNNQFIEQTERDLVYFEAIKNKNEAWEKYQEINNKYIDLGIEWSERWNCEDFKAASDEYSAANRRCEELDPIKCNCGGDCVGKCSGSSCGCDKLTCIRRVPTDRNTNILYFGDYYIEY